MTFERELMLRSDWHSAARFSHCNSSGKPKFINDPCNYTPDTFYERRNVSLLD